MFLLGACMGNQTSKTKLLKLVRRYHPSVGPLQQKELFRELFIENPTVTNFDKMQPSPLCFLRLLRLVKMSALVMSIYTVNLPVAIFCDYFWAPRTVALAPKFEI